jgi:GNAT superfamily N-acetyltransferase
MEIIQSTSIHDYSPLMDGLYDDFGSNFFMTLLRWCEITNIGRRRGKGTNVFWEVWIIKEDNVTVGICGLYSLFPNDTETLWLGWFGVLPQYRCRDIGGKVLIWLKEEAKKRGAKALMSYVDEDGKPLAFYKRYGFKVVGNVGDYIIEHRLEIEDFNDLADYIIRCELI